MEVAMTKQTYEFEFDANTMGRGWLNPDNLALLLYSTQHTRKDLLKVRQVKRSILGRIVIGLAAVLLVVALLVLALFVMVMAGITVWDISRVAWS
jgi:hypothetical protein